MNEVEKIMEYSMVGRIVFDMLICEVVEKRLYMYEYKEEIYWFLELEDEFGGFGVVIELLEVFEFLEQSMLQMQGLFLDGDYV